MTSLFQKYRPHEWKDVIGHQKVKQSLQMMRQRGSLGGRAFWISGPSGTGKTTICYLVAEDICDESNFIELDAGGITPKDIDDLERSLRMRCLGEKSGRAVLINESHGLRQDTIRKLLVVLERIPAHVTWLFSTTDVGNGKLFKDDAHPLLSRCVNFELKVEDYAGDMIKRVMEIAAIEGLGGATHDEFVKLATDCKFNCRAMLTEIEKGTMMREVVTVRGNIRKPQVARAGIDWDAVEMVSA